MDTGNLKRFAAEARNILKSGVATRLTALGFNANGEVKSDMRPEKVQGGTIFMGQIIPDESFFDRWTALYSRIQLKGIKEVYEEAAYTWFNRLMAIRILQKNGFIEPILDYASENIRVPRIVEEAQSGHILTEMYDADKHRLEELLNDPRKVTEQFSLLINSFCHFNPIIKACFGGVTEYAEILLPNNILAEGGFIDLLNHTEFIKEEDYRSPELIGWLYQFYISEKKDEVFAKKGKVDADEIPAATQIFTPNWIVKYMTQNTLGRIYLDNEPYSSLKDNMKYLVEPSEPTPDDCKFKFTDIHDLTCADLACGSGHILNELFDLLLEIYVEEGYSNKQAIEDIFEYNLTGIDLDTRAKQLATFALLLKACQKDSSFLDAHALPRVLDMPNLQEFETYLKATEAASPDFNGEENKVHQWKNFITQYFLGMNNKLMTELLMAFGLMKDADNLGSIMKFDFLSQETIDAIHYRTSYWHKETDVPEVVTKALPFFDVVVALTKKYATLIANPPYMGRGNMNSKLAEYLNTNYPDTKQDLYSAFMELMIEKTSFHARCAFITMESWMFLSTFENMRRKILDNYYISSLGHFGWHIIGIAFGTAMTVIEKSFANERRGVYSYLTIDDINKTSNIPFVYPVNNNGRYSITNQSDFKKIPGAPIGYWVSEAVLKAFANENLYPKTISDGQTKTGDNNKFLREIWEVSSSKVGLGKKWLFYAKGGGFRRWYGNLNTTINWSPEARAFYKKDKIARILPEYLWEKEGITWSYICSAIPSFRTLIRESVFDVGGSSVFFKKDDDIFPILGFLNSKFAYDLLKIYNPTINYQVNDIRSLPINNAIYNNHFISDIVKENINISNIDWDAHETSWNFEMNPLVLSCLSGRIEGNKTVFIPKELKVLFSQYELLWGNMFRKLHENEEELNRQFIEIYGLQEELTPDVPLNETTILQQGEVSIIDNQLIFNADVVMKQLISYAVGCMMGRYSIDIPGLILANQGDGIEQFNELVPDHRFEIDDDGILPLMDTESGFADNASLRFKEWLSITFGEETLVLNLNFIESAIGKSIDDYFVKDFWKDHKKMYQNRPIYWLFSSKKGAFQCIAYMHRMDAYTVTQIRNKYLLPFIERLNTRVTSMEAISSTLSSKQRSSLEKMRKQLVECQEYDERLHSVADAQIAFDLDDGVVVNYAKFGDVLAKLK